MTEGHTRTRAPLLPQPAFTRLWRCVLGLVLLGVGLGLTVEANLGLSPWDVLHQGLSNRTPLTIGQASILVGIVVLALWVPLRERPGMGTVLNVVVIGVVLDLTIWLVPSTDLLVVRIPEMVIGALVWGPGSGLYLGARLGAGPRDGLMTALERRGMAVGPVRAVIEITALAIGYALGGSVGVGTVFFAVVIGPVVAFWLPRLAMDESGPAITT